MASSADYLRDLAKCGYSFRFNLATDRIEVNGMTLTDVTAAEIRTRMRDLRHKQMSAIEDAYTTEAWVNRYHPIRDYLSALQWDGQPHIARLGDYICDQRGVFVPFLRRWMIGAVGKAFESAQNVMLVLDGPQDIGKSYFCYWLCPPTLQAYAIEGAIATDDKDSWLRLASSWLWEVSELGATTRKADREALKDFISRRDVTIRRPYARYDESRPALASLIGTINEEGSGFLNDPTGSRRFAVVNLTAIDRRYTNAFDVDQLWAEAFVAYQAGEPWQFTDDERATQTQINDEYEVGSPLEGLLLKYYDIDPASPVWTSSTDIIQELELFGLKDNQRASLMELARVMKRLEVERQRIRRVYSYRGVTRKTGVVI